MKCFDKKKKNYLYLSRQTNDTFLLTLIYTIMIKNILYFLLFLVGISSFYSCQKEEQQLLTSEAKTDELSLESLSENEDFIAYTEANVKFLNDYHAWHNALTASERTIYDKKIANALENEISEDLKPSHISKEEFANFQNQQTARVSAIMVKYPELRKMEASYDFVSKAFTKTMNKQKLQYNNSNATMRTEGDCFAGYNACSWAAFDAGSDINACYVGYLACSGN